MYKKFLDRVFWASSATDEVTYRARLCLLVLVAFWCVLELGCFGCVQYFTMYAKAVTRLRLTHLFFFRRLAHRYAGQVPRRREGAQQWGRHGRRRIGNKLRNQRSSGVRRTGDHRMKTKEICVMFVILSNTFSLLYLATLQVHDSNESELHIYLLRR